MPQVISRRRVPLWPLIAGLSLLLVAVVTAAITYAHGRYQSIVVVPNVSPSPSIQEPTPDPQRPFSILLMGYGGGGHQGGKLTDTMMIAYFQPRLQTVHLVSLPRDLWVKLPIVEGQAPSGWKINAAYALGSDDTNYRRKPPEFSGKAGGGQLAKFAVKQATGLEIDHFVTLNFASFVKSIDVLGGVDVQVERAFDDYLYPIEGKEQDTCGRSEEEMLAVSATLSAEKAEPLFTCRYEHLHFNRGLQEMDGETALKFVRSRHSAQDGTDFGRAARQRNLLVGIKNKILEINFIPKAIPFMSTLANDLQTDIDISRMQELLALQNELREYSIITVALTNENVLQFGRSSSGQFIVMPKAGEDQWQEVHEYVKQSLTKTTAVTDTATASAKPVPASQKTQ